MTELLANHIAGRWQNGSGQGATLLDPVLGTALVRVDAQDWTCLPHLPLPAKLAAKPCAP